MRLLALLSVIVVAPTLRAQNPQAPRAPQAPQIPAAWDSVARILKSAPAPQNGYMRYNFPRRDLNVKVGNTAVPTGALTSWVGFGGTPADADVMGDLVTVGHETGAVLAELAHQGIDVLAIHNHLTGDSPAVTYVHFHAHGAATAIAVKMDVVLARTAVPRPVEAGAIPPLTIDTALVFGILGETGRAQGSSATVSFMLVPGTVTMHGHALVPALAYASPIGFQMIANDRLLALGDLAVPAVKVQAVLGTLAVNGIDATAVHTHLIGEEPRVYFIHFWAEGAPRAVLSGLRSAIDAAR